MMDSVIIFLNTISPFSPIIPFGVGLIFRRKLIQPQHTLWAMVIVGGLTEIGARMMSHYYGNNLPLYHLYIIAEFSLLSLVFSQGYEGLLPAKHHRVLIVVFAALATLDIFFFQPLGSYPSHTRTLEGILLLGLALRYFYLVLKELKIPHIERSFMFWFATAILLYFSANLLLFIYSNYIVGEDSRTFLEVWAIHAFLNILLYLLYTVALCVALQPLKSPRFS